MMKTKFSHSQCHRFLSTGLVSNFFISSDNLEGKHYLDFVSVQKQLHLGSSFTKVNKKRVRKRCLETFLKSPGFDNEKLLFERMQFIKNVYQSGN